MFMVIINHKFIHHQIKIKIHNNKLVVHKIQILKIRIYLIILIINNSIHFNKIIDKIINKMFLGVVEMIHLMVVWVKG